MPKAKAAKKRSGYTLPEKFTNGFVLKDIFKTPWTVGDPIGQGGFGLIYLANKGESNRVNINNAEFVIKIEPKDNGPLFCETHFYINCAKEEDINNFMKSYQLKVLGIPRYISSGLCEFNGKSYRFLVMNRYLKDLQTILNELNNCLPEYSVLYMTRQILYALEYIHSKGYAHGDIKGANLLLKNDNEIYLVDYGLAQRFSRDGTHQMYTEKPERKHNGTIEYTSRDAHNGALPSRRTDLEILGYCIVHWTFGTLPWLNVLKNPDQVQNLKITNMKSPKEFLKNVAQNSTNDVSDQVKLFIDFFLNIVNKLKYDEEPNYFQIQTKINQTLQSISYSIEDNFNLISTKAVKTNTKRKLLDATSAATNKSKSKSNLANDDSDTPELLNNENQNENSKRTRKAIIAGSPVNAIKNKLTKATNGNCSPELSAKDKNSHQENINGVVNKRLYKSPQREEAAKSPLRITPARAAKQQSSLNVQNLINERTKSPLNIRNNADRNQLIGKKSPINKESIEKEDKFLIKRRRNVQKSTISTQTELSCFAKTTK